MRTCTRSLRGILLAFFCFAVVAEQQVSVSADVNSNSGWASKSNALKLRQGRGWASSSSTGKGNGWNSKSSSGSGWSSLTGAGTGSGWSSLSSGSNSGWNSIVQGQGSGWAAVNSNSNSHTGSSSGGGGWQSQSSSTTPAPAPSSNGFDWTSSVNENEGPPVFVNLEPIIRIVIDFVSWLFSSPPPPPPPPSEIPIMESGNFSQSRNDTNSTNHF